MKTSLLGRWTLLALMLAFTTAATRAEDDGFHFPNLNPFKSEPKRTTASVSDDRSGFSLPTLSMPSLGGDSGRSTKSISRKPEPSMFNKVTTGTKNFFGKTYDVLTPWDNDPPPPPRYGSSRKKPASRGFNWDPLNLFGSDEPEEIHTVNDWLALPRPEINPDRR